MSDIMFDSLAGIREAIAEHFRNEIEIARTLSKALGTEDEQDRVELAEQFLEHATTMCLSLFEGMQCTATIMSQGTVAVLVSLPHHPVDGMGWKIVSWEDE